MRFGLQNTFTYTVEKGGCETCTVYDHTFGYNRTASSSNSGYTGKEVPLNMTGALFSSYYIEDKVCLKMIDGCVDQFQFYVINRQDELHGYDLPQHRQIDGVVNLSPKSNNEKGSLYLELRKTYPGVNFLININ
jgi:hypothetical protein